MPKILGFHLMACLILVPALGQAQEARQDPRVANAKTACAAGDVKQAIHLLAELYTETNDPIWVFNQGRCYQQNNLFPQGVARFKEFLRKNTNGPVEDSREAQQYIDEMEAEMRRQEAAGVAPPVASPVPVAAVAPVSIQIPQPQAPGPQAGRGLRRAGVAVLALGGASLAAGVVFALLMRQAQSDIEARTKSGPVPYSTVSEKFSDGRTYEDLQWVGYGVGVSAAITGGVLYYLGARKAREAAAATLVAPLAVAGGAGAILYHAF